MKFSDRVKAGAVALIMLFVAGCDGGEPEESTSETVETVVVTDESGAPVTDESGNPVITSVEIKEVNGVPLVTYAFSMRLGNVAGKLLAVAILLFAFSTVLGWSFYGTKSREYLFGTKATVVYKIIFVCFIVVGCTMNLQLAWDIADTLNALMAIPNLIGVLILSGTVVKITRNYVNRNIKGKEEQPMLSIFPDIENDHAEKIKSED